MTEKPSPKKRARPEAKAAKPAAKTTPAKKPAKPAAKATPAKKPAESVTTMAGPETKAIPAKKPIRRKWSRPYNKPVEDPCYKEEKAKISCEARGVELAGGDAQTPSGIPTPLLGLSNISDIMGLDPSAETQRAKANSLIKSYVLGSAAVGAVPLPLFDLAGLTFLQTRMAGELAKIYGVPVSTHRVRAIIVGLLSGGASLFLGKFLLTSVTKSIPGFGSWFGALTFSTVSGALTYAVGTLFRDEFQKGNNPSSQSIERLRPLFKERFRKGREYVAQQIQAAKKEGTSNAV